MNKSTCSQCFAMIFFFFFSFTDPHKLGVRQLAKKFNEAFTPCTILYREYKRNERFFPQKL